MAFDEDLAGRVRDRLADLPGVTERKMFGGLAFMLAGNMCCGIVGDDLMVRVGPDAHEDATARPHVREMDFTGRPMAGFVLVAPPGTDGDTDLAGWVDRGVAFARTLPAK